MADYYGETTVDIGGAKYGVRFDADGKVLQTQCVGWWAWTDAATGSGWLFDQLSAAAIAALGAMNDPEAPTAERDCSKLADLADDVTDLCRRFRGKWEYAATDEDDLPTSQQLAELAEAVDEAGQLLMDVGSTVRFMGTQAIRREGQTAIDAKPEVYFADGGLGYQFWVNVTKSRLQHWLAATRLSDGRVLHTHPTISATATHAVMAGIDEGDQIRGVHWIDTAPQGTRA